jgi:hypothetical protein
MLLVLLFSLRSNPCRYKVHAEDGFDTIIVVDRVPVIAEHQRDALLGRLVKVFSRKGCPIKSEDILIPWDDNTQKSKGYVCVVVICVFYLFFLVIFLSNLRPRMKQLLP